MSRDFNGLWIESAAPFPDAGSPPRTLPLPGVGRLVLSPSGALATLELAHSLLTCERYARRVEESFTLLFARFWHKLRLPRSPLVLVVALGNEQIAADALGAETVRRIEVNEHLHQAGVFKWGNRLAAVKGSVSGLTGIPSFDVIKGVCERLHPDAVVAVDTLAAKNSARLARAIQFSLVGITPGAGVGNPKTTLNADTLGVPVLALGVPLVIYASRLLAEGGATKLPESVRELIVTPKEIEGTVASFARLIANGVNTVAHRKFLKAY